MTLDFNPSTLTADERVSEKDRILRILFEDVGIVDNIITESESKFLNDMEDATSVSPAQLNWLRRIKDKYL